MSEHYTLGSRADRRPIMRDQLAATAQESGQSALVGTGIELRGVPEGYMEPIHTEVVPTGLEQMPPVGALLIRDRRHDARPYLVK